MAEPGGGGAWSHLIFLNFFMYLFFFKYLFGIFVCPLCFLIQVYKVVVRICI